MAKRRITDEKKRGRESPVIRAKYVFSWLPIKQQKIIDKTYPDGILRNRYGYYIRAVDLPPLTRIDRMITDETGHVFRPIEDYKRRNYKQTQGGAQMAERYIIICFTLPHKLYIQMEQLRKKLGMSRSAFIRQAVEYSLEKER